MSYPPIARGLVLTTGDRDLVEQLGDGHVTGLYLETEVFWHRWLEQIGNVPQAFTHLALIAAVLNLDHELDHPTAPEIRRLAAAAGRA